jgi:hypothetical protein
LEKNDHIRVPDEFFEPGRAEICGKNWGCPKAVNGRFFWGKSAVFFKTGHNSGVFSTRTETGDITGIS